MRKIKLILVLASFVFISNSYAQSSLYEDFLRGGVNDANVLFNYYMAPGLKGVGYGFNSGWYNTAKPHETFGFDITISYNNAIVPVVDQTFEFIQAEYENTILQSGSSTLPTLMGGSTNSFLAANYQGLMSSYKAPDGVAANLAKYNLLKDPAIPSPIIQAGIGLFKGTEIKVRWLPTVNIETLNFKYFGIGGLHSLSQWIPVFKKLPIDISAFVGWTSITSEYIIPTGNIGGANQRSTSDISTFTYQLIASAHISVLTGYIGIGMDNFKTSFKMLGEYKLDPNNPALDLIDPVLLEQSGTGGFRSTMGLRLKLAIFTLHADYTFREYNTLNVGLGFSFR
jgi:uncharacterized protein DUF6588